MDNLTHALVGAGLAKTALGARLRHASFAAVLAANVPDTDIVARLYGGTAAYLSDHRGITHSIVGVLACVPLVAWLHWLLERRHGGRFVDTLRLALAVLASHPLLDSLNSYGIRPFLPFDATWYYGDLVFIVDPWLWLVLGGAVALAGERTPLGSRWLGLAALGTTAALAAYTRSTAITGAWLAAIGSLAVARRLGIGRESKGLVLASAAGLVGVYLASLRVASESAREHGGAWLAERLEPDETHVDDAANPEALDPRAWRVFLMTQRFVHVVDWRFGDGAGGYVRLDRGTDSAFVERALAVDCTVAWRSFARFPHAAVEPDEHGRAVHLMDARYQLAPGEVLHAQAAKTAGPAWSEALVRFDDDGKLVECSD
ncbi:MAG: metal-dependent hydrolase [Planctomycetes bacterium]|nr:metal-dependent hydrolase [Planctomycetota bacterium]